MREFRIEENSWEGVVGINDVFMGMEKSKWDRLVFAYRINEWFFMYF